MVKFLMVGSGKLFESDPFDCGWANWPNTESLMACNISSTNRIIRIFFGSIFLLTTAFFLNSLNVWLLVLGLVLVITGLVGFCPIQYYSKMKQEPK